MSLETTQENATSPEPEKLLRRLTHRIRRSLELEDILKATVIEVGEFLSSDRVAVYQFYADIAVATLVRIRCRGGTSGQ